MDNAKLPSNVQIPRPLDDLDNVRENFWHVHASNSRYSIDSEDKLWDWLKNLPTSIKWKTGGEDTTYFRGQANIQHGLTSYLFREVQREIGPGGVVSESTVAKAERRILNDASKEGIGRRMTDLETLAVLQHHGIPTRLLDVSRTPLEALFFAVSQDTGSDGVLFLISPHPPENPLRIDTQDLPWKDASRGEMQSDSSWTNKVFAIDSPALDPRMRAQNGIFLVGGMLKSYNGVYYNDPRREAGPPQGMREGTIVHVSNLAVNWLKSRPKSRNDRWGASGEIIVIPAEWKKSLLSRLAAEEITKDSIYPPIDESRRLLRRSIGQAIKP